MPNNLNMTYFGSSKFSVFCLNELKALDCLPDLIITTPDMPTGRGLKLTPNPVRNWANENKVECLTPDKLNLDFLNQLQAKKSNLFLVASYGKIIPKIILDIPKYGTLNIHPSLLPKYRGPSPLQEQILNDEKNVGVTIMLMDEKVDHGPIIAQKKITLPKWPIKFEELKKILAKEGANQFTYTINDWMTGKLTPVEQNHSEATFTKKVLKTDGLIDIENGDPYKNFLKFLAYSTWPQTYFFIEKNNKKIRVIIKNAKFNDGQLEILQVLPEGKKEMSYTDFLNGLKN